jgi:indole-3-acetate monooxygenase
MSDLVDQARILQPDIVSAQADMDGMHRLPDALAEKFRDAGFYRLCIPKSHDGIEAEPSVIFEVLETLAEADASAAWCVMIGATTGSFGAYLEPELGRPIFSDPKLIFTGVYAPMGKAVIEGDSYRVTGQWKWNSGGQNATWLCGGCTIHENGAPRMLTDKIPDQRMMLFPASEVTFIDTWRTSGLRGTGSGDIAVRDLLVPRARSVSLMTDKPTSRAPLYRFPIFGLLAIGIAAVACGNARAALREFAAMAKSKRLPGGRTLADRGTTQAEFAEATAAVEAARAYLLSEIDLAWTDAVAGQDISLSRRASLRLAATHMTRTAAEMVRRVQDLAGGASVFLEDPLNRRLRDAQTMTAHIMTAPATYELTGRALLGVSVSSFEL